MGKLAELYKNLIEKIKVMSTGRKIAFSIMLIGIIVFILLFGSYTSSNKFGVLFSGLTPEDGKMISDKLKADKVTTQIKGTAIYVPKDQVDSLRLELAPSLTNGSQGYELMDSGSSLGMTDSEFQLKKLRATQGELEKTIKSFSQIVNARVHLTLPEESAFVKDTKPGKAAVYLQLKPGMKLTNEQVKAIVSLLSGSVQSIPKENVEVIDDEMNLISNGIFNENSAITASNSLEKQQTAEALFEERLQNNVIELLEPAIGSDRVKVKVNANLDFDSKEQTQVTYDPNKVELSTHNIQETNQTGGTNNTQSPIDNNMSNTVTNVNSGIISSSKVDNTVNYNNGSTVIKTISAPGEVKRVTASVMIDGKLDDATKTEIQKIVATAIGYKQDRGDDISILAMNFNPGAKDAIKAELDSMNAQVANENRLKLYKTIALGAGSIILILAFVIFLTRLKKPTGQLATAGVDVVIGDEILPKEKVSFAAIDLDIADDEKNHVEKEIKKYALEKPDQVADIIKSWLTEDER